MTTTGSGVGVGGEGPSCWLVRQGRRDGQVAYRPRCAVPVDQCRRDDLHAGVREHCQGPEIGPVPGETKPNRRWV